MSGHYLVDFQFSDPEIKRLDATVWYHNALKERVVLKHNDRVNTQGRFLFELKATEQWKNYLFISLDVAIDERYPTGLTLTATMCRRDRVAT